MLKEQIPEAILTVYEWIYKMLYMPSVKEIKRKKQKGTSIESYRRGVMLLDGTATHFKLPVTLQTRTTWTNVLVGIKRADERFDSAKNPKDCKEKISQTIAYLKGNIKIPDPIDPDIKFRKAMETLKAEIDKSSPDGRSLFLENFANVCEITQRIKTAKTAHDYALFTKMEGHPTAILLVSLLPDDFKSKLGYKKFERLLISITTVVNNIDSIVDLSADKNEGQAEVKSPNKWVQLNLIGVVWKDLFYITPKILSHKRARTEIIRVIKEGIQASKPA